MTEQRDFVSLTVPGQEFQDGFDDYAELLPRISPTSSSASGGEMICEAPICNQLAQPSEASIDQAGLMPRGTSSSSTEMLCEHASAEAENGYMPVSYIDPEVRALISHWEASARIKSVFSESKTETQASLYDPVRGRDVSFPPPKKFYRRFWRSLAKRYLQMSVCT